MQNFVFLTYFCQKLWKKTFGGGEGEGGHKCELCESSDIISPRMKVYSTAPAW